MPLSRPVTNSQSSSDGASDGASSAPPVGSSSPSRLVALVGLAMLSLPLYVGICLSGQSLYEEGTGGHSLLTVLGLFGLAFVLYLLSIRVALRVPQDRRLVGVILVAAVVFRLTMLFSNPIEEIDLYRYLWDGIATTSGVDPFRYSPDQVLAASSRDDAPADLARLVARYNSSPEIAQVLRRVHFSELPTIYPPVSQIVFALAAAPLPNDASLWTRMMAMKAAFVACDLGTVLVVLLLVKFTGRPIGWTIAYAWCPLVLKEFANSGHLDALAVLLATSTLYLTVRAVYPLASAERRGGTSSSAAIGASIMLGLAVGAKFYPLVLAPLVFATFARRCSWRLTIAATVAFVSTTALVTWPMWPRESTASRQVIQHQTTAADLPPLPPPEESVEPQDPSHSLRTFLNQWEMNDFLFLLVMENIRPTCCLPPQDIAWFSIVPDTWRQGLISAGDHCLAVNSDQSPFFLSRIITSLLFVALAGLFAWRGMRADTPSAWLEQSFLTLAWFWLLLPTLNPWYWTWALPLVAFARGRAWLLLSGLVLLYYFRFWLVYHYPASPVLGTRYPGAQFFDFVVTWLEFGPWFGWLAIEWILRMKGTTK
jgi:hypothetical protein